MILSQKPSPSVEQEQPKPVQVGLGQLQVPQAVNPQKLLGGLSADSWRNLQNHARLQPTAPRQANQITALGNAVGPSSLQLPVNCTQPAIVDDSKQNVEMLNDKVQQQLLMLGPNGLIQRPNQLGVPTDRKEVQQFTTPRPSASSVVAAAHDPFKTPPQKKQEYAHEQ